MLVKNPNLHIRRFELKYLVPDSDLDKIRHAISNFVIPDPNAKEARYGKYQVTSTYFDDLAYSAYLEKLAGIKIRKKFRIRSYSKKVSASSTIFLEIKRRDEAIIFKDRSPLKFDDIKRILNFGEYERLDSSGDVDVATQFISYIVRKRLRPTVMTSYLREAYLDAKNFSFRLTLDQNLSAKVEEEISLDNRESKEVLKDYAILEAKFNRIMPAWFGIIVKSFNLERIPFSKYCWALENCGIVHKSEISILAGLWI